MTQEYTRGLWSEKEKKSYICFLREKREHMMHSSTRRSQKLFIQMSKWVKTRTPDQCRSHHQKTMKYHHTIDETINFFTNIPTSIFINNQSIVHPLLNPEDVNTSEGIKVEVQGSRAKIELKCELVA